MGVQSGKDLLLKVDIDGTGAFRTVAPSLHTLTNMHIVERFLPVEFTSREASSEKSNGCRFGVPFDTSDLTSKKYFFIFMI